jgi:hypothetical protein
LVFGLWHLPACLTPWLWLWLSWVRASSVNSSSHIYVITHPAIWFMATLSHPSWPRPDEYIRSPSYTTDIIAPRSEAKNIITITAVPAPSNLIWNVCILFCSYNEATFCTIRTGNWINWELLEFALEHLESVKSWKKTIECDLRKPALS